MAGPPKTCPERPDQLVPASRLTSKIAQFTVQDPISEQHRTEVTDRMLIFGERHLRLVLAEYARHYNGRRPHRSRELRPPRPDHPVADLSQERIKRRPVLGGLLSEYKRAA